MVGVPPFGGFFSKWWLLVGSLEAGSLPCAAVIVASGLLSAGYFFRALDRLFLSPAEGGRAEAPALMLLPAAGAALAVLAFGLGSDWLRTSVIEPALPAELLR
jgi:multicomponent Na+:H+ antiporter subunit D